jgi:hypothetical protein
MLEGRARRKEEKRKEHCEKEERAACGGEYQVEKRVRKEEQYIGEREYEEKENIGRKGVCERCEM